MAPFGRSSQSHAQYVPLEDDEGFSNARLLGPRAKGRVPGKQSVSREKGASEPSRGISYSSDLSNAQQEPENKLTDEEMQVLDESRSLNSATLAIARTAEKTEELAIAIMIDLEAQGKRISGVHQTVEKAGEELVEGEKQLSKLGSFLSYWRPRRRWGLRRKSVTSAAENDASEKEFSPLRLTGWTKRRASDLELPGGNALGLVSDTVTEDFAFQDGALDCMINSLSRVKEVAVGIGQEMDRQNAALEVVADDIITTRDLAKHANERMVEMM